MSKEGDGRSGRPAYGRGSKARPRATSSPRGSHLASDLHGRHAHGRYACQEVDDFLFVVGKAVVVEPGADGGVLGFLFLVLVEDPLQRRAVAEPVVPGF